jgi:hypothetical protein
LIATLLNWDAASDNDSGWRNRWHSFRGDSREEFNGSRMPYYVTRNIDGSGQTVYFDDLTYATATVPEPAVPIGFAPF